MSPVLGHMTMSPASVQFGRVRRSSNVVLSTLRNVWDSSCLRPSARVGPRWPAALARTGGQPVVAQFPELGGQLRPCARVGLRWAAALAHTGGSRWWPSLQNQQVGADAAAIWRPGLGPHALSAFTDAPARLFTSTLDFQPPARPPTCMEARIVCGHVCR